MIYFVTYSKIPDGDALAIRSCNIARIFKACGRDVAVLGMGNSDYLVPETHEGLSIVSLRLKGDGILTRLKNYFGFKKRLKKILDQANNADAIILSSLPINALLYIKKISKRKKIKLIIDCCEWFSPEQFKRGKLSIPYMLNAYYVRKYIDNSTRVIAISKYLFTYFNQKKYQVAKIPVILDVEHTGCSKNPKSEKTILMYAGSVGRKDYLNIILNGLSLLGSQDLAKIEFRIFGVTLNEVRTICRAEILDKVYNSVKCYGRVAREVVLKNLEDVDFTALMRSSTQRYAKAGFPTKVVESLASATPVICNLTSDLADYIIDEYNGVVVRSESAEDFSQAVKKTIGLSASEKEMMSSNARRTAKENFDYRLYKDQLMTLFESVQ